MQHNNVADRCKNTTRIIQENIKLKIDVIFLDVPKPWKETHVVL